MSHFTGHRNPGRHRTVGSHRAWCECGSWCYPRIEAACYCCAETLAEERPCPTCDGTGIAPVLSSDDPTYKEWTP